MSNKCRFKDKPKSKWSINKTPEMTQAQHVMQEHTKQETAQPKLAGDNNQDTVQAQAVMAMPMSWMGNQVTFVQQE